MDTQINKIKEFLQNNNQDYVDIDNDTSVSKIYDLFYNKKVFEPLTTIEYVYLAFGYTYLYKNLDKMVAYHNYAIDKGYKTSLYFLGNYYRLKKMHDVAILYYKMAYENSIYLGVSHIGNYYYDISVNYKLMKYWHLIGIKHGNYHSMNNLGFYYSNIKNKYELTKKYYLMAIDHGCIVALRNLGIYYIFKEKNYKLMRMYFLMSSITDNEGITRLEQYYNDNNDPIKKLELYLNHPSLTDNKNVIDLVNNIMNQKLTKKQINKFRSLLSQINFENNNYFANLQMLI